MFWAGLSTMQVAMFTLAAAATAAAHGRRPAPRRCWARAPSSSRALAAVGIRAKAGSWDVWLLKWQYPSLVAFEDTPYARVVVTRAEGQVAVFANGALAFDTEGTSAEAFADLAALQHPRPRRALVIGGGVEGVPAALAAHGLAAIDNVEIDEPRRRARPSA